MKKIRQFLILSVCFLFLYDTAFSQISDIPVLKSPFTDLTNTLTNDEINLIKNKLFNFEEDSIGQFVIVIISSTEPETIEEYSMRLAEEWKIGSADKDDGLILLVAKDDRKIRIEVGYGLEEIITDAEASNIIDNIIVPEFKSGDFFNGINQGADRIIGIIRGEIVPYEETYYESDITEANNSNDIFNNDWYIAFIVILITANFGLFFLARARFMIFMIYLLILLSLDFIAGLLENDFTTSWAFMIVTGVFGFIPFLINLIGTVTGRKGKMFTSSSWSSSSYSGSSSSSSSSYSSWSSSSSSSYSGGGGSFGGGGSSGSW